MKVQFSGISNMKIKACIGFFVQIKIDLSVVDVLPPFHKDKQRVSLATVAAKSKELDPEHRGILSESAMLDNQEARAYYEQHRSWRGSSRKRAKPPVASMEAVKLGRLSWEPLVACRMNAPGRTLVAAPIGRNKTQTILTLLQARGDQPHLLVGDLNALHPRSKEEIWWRCR